MGTCELCGTNQVSTYKTSTSGTHVDACIRCIDKLGLPKPNISVNTNPTKQNIPKTKISTGNIMSKAEKELAPDFHKRIREGREEKGWDQREFARRMNERLNIVQRTENGNRPTDALIKKIEKVLDIELFIASEPANTRAATTIGSRNMTIGDAYDELFSRRE